MKTELTEAVLRDKTEFAWVDSWLYEKAGGRLVAEVRHMTRRMKASSPLWALPQKYRIVSP